jgi:hypothetical protein
MGQPRNHLSLEELVLFELGSLIGGPTLLMAGVVFTC